MILALTKSSGKPPYSGGKHALERLRDAADIASTGGSIEFYVRTCSAKKTEECPEPSQLVWTARSGKSSGRVGIVLWGNRPALVEVLPSVRALFDNMLTASAYRMFLVPQEGGEVHVN